MGIAVCRLPGSGWRRVCCLQSPTLARTTATYARLVGESVSASGVVLPPFVMYRATAHYTSHHPRIEYEAQKMAAIGHLHSGSTPRVRNGGLWKMKMDRERWVDKFWHHCPQKYSGLTSQMFSFKTADLELNNRLNREIPAPW
jgi:hypothetical protein